MNIRTTLRFLVAAAIFFSFLALSSTPSFAQGSFTGRVVVEWLTGQNPERDMRLIEPFSYTDPKGKKWSVPAGAVINGASIPPSLWSVVGSPYTGSYRRASVIHDYYCGTRSETWQDVHRMFYYAMIAGGVDTIQAKVFYAAVYGGGPRWKAIVSKNLEGNDETTIVPVRTTVSSSALEKTNAWIRSTSPSLEDIERQLDTEVVVR
jgi:hypothetical protein